MGPKFYTVQCIVSGEETPQIASFPWDFVTLPGEDRATTIGNMHRKIDKDRVVPEISSRTDRQTHGHTHRDVLITILPHCDDRRTTAE